MDVVEQGEHSRVYSIGAVSAGRLAVRQELGRSAARRRRARRLLLARLRRRRRRRSAGAEPVLLHSPGEAATSSSRCSCAADPVDVVTPYGYGGPVGAGDAAAGGVPGRLRGVVRAARRDLELRRVPPAARQRRAPRRGFRARALAGTVAWALGGPTCWPGCTGTIAGSCGARRRRATTSAVEPAPADLGEFVGVYEQTMRARGRGAVLLLPAARTGTRWWREVKLVRVDVRERGALVASVLGMGEPPWLHYHLGGAADAGARHRRQPPRAATSSPRWGSEHGYDDAAPGRRRRRPRGLAARVQAALRARTGGCRSRDRQGGPRRAPATCGSAGAAAIDWDAFFPAYREPQPARLTGSRSRRASAKRSSRPRSCTSRRRRKLTLRISSLW